MDIINSEAEGRAWITEAEGRAETGSEGSPSAASSGKTEGRAEKEKKPAGISLLDKAPKNVAVVIPGAGGPEEEKPKKRKSPSKSKANVDEYQTLLNSFLSSCFYLAAAKDPEIWTVTPEEVSSISTPGGKILAKLDKSGKASEYSDGIALMFALGMVVGTRIIKSVNKRKLRVKGGIQLARTNKKGPGEISHETYSPGPQIAADDSGNLASVLPSVG